MLICNSVSKRQLSRGGAAAARVAHNHKVAGSSPAPATKIIKLGRFRTVFFVTLIIMDGDIYLEIWILSVLAIIVGITFFSIWGLRKTYKQSSSQKIIVTSWILLTIPLVLIENLQSLAAISGFFLFLYIVWFGVIKPTLK